MTRKWVICVFGFSRQRFNCLTKFSYANKIVVTIYLAMNSITSIIYKNSSNFILISQFYFKATDLKFWSELTSKRNVTYWYNETHHYWAFGTQLWRKWALYKWKERHLILTKNSSFSKSHLLLTTVSTHDREIFEEK